MIELKKVAIGYQKKGGVLTVQENINGCISKGKLVGLLGGNGKGKSTLLRTILGLQPALKGEVLIQGIPLSGISAKAMAKEVAVVLTDKIQTPYMTVRELIESGRSPHTNWWGKLRHDDLLLIEQVIEQLGIDAIQHRPFNELSDGQKQLSLIGRALAQDTGVILLDEPAAHLDVPNKIRIFSLLQQLSRGGKTVLICSHDLDLSLRFCDDLLLLHQEELPVLGMAEELVLNGTFGRYFNQGEIQFNIQSGRFDFQKKFRRQVNIDTVPSPQRRWLVQALHKKEIGICPLPTENEIQLKDSQWHFNSQQFDHLSPLINAIDTYLT